MSSVCIFSSVSHSSGKLADEILKFLLYSLRMVETVGKLCFLTIIALVPCCAYRFRNP